MPAAAAGAVSLGAAGEHRADGADSATGEAVAAVVAAPEASLAVVGAAGPAVSQEVAVVVADAGAAASAEEDADSEPVAMCWVTSLRHGLSRSWSGSSDGV